ncbi:unnamed protein product, partial [Arabidopsis halleri]
VKLQGCYFQRECSVVCKHVVWCKLDSLWLLVLRTNSLDKVVAA